MSTQPSQAAVSLLRTLYAAFNDRNIEAAVISMAENVAWPRAFKGGFVQGRQAVTAYWTEQWSEIDPHVEPEAFVLEEDGCILVIVHQLVRNLAGAVMVEEHVGHRYTLSHASGLVEKMEVASVSPPSVT